MTLALLVRLALVNWWGELGVDKKFSVIKLNNRDAEIYEWREYKHYGLEWYNYHDNNGNYMRSSYMHDSNTKYCDTLQEAEIIKLEMNHPKFLEVESDAEGEIVKCKKCSRMYDIDDCDLYEGSSVYFGETCVCGEKISGIIEPVISARVVYD